MSIAPQTASRDIDHTIYDLRKKMARITGEPVAAMAPASASTAAPASAPSPFAEPASAPSSSPSPAPTAAPRFGHITTLPSPPWLERAVDMGGIPRAMVTAVADCPAVHVELLVAATRAGSCVAVVGYPHLALAAVDAAGGDLERMMVIPDPAPHAGAVLGTLVESLDMVFYRPVKNASPTFTRPVEARLHKSRCALVVSGHAWPKVQLNIDAHVVGIRGLGRGSGRVRGVEVDGRVWGKSQPPRSFHAVVGATSSFMVDATPEPQEIAR